MTIQEIIDSLEDQAADKDRLAGGDPDSIFTCDADALIEAVKMLRKAYPPNDPLTLEELREMDGEPVWVKTKWGGRYVVICCCGSHFTGFTDGWQLQNNEYGKTWLAYRRKPEEGTT